MLPQHHTCPAFAGSLLSATPEAHRWPGRGLLPHPLGWGGGRQDQTRDKVLAQAGQQPFPRPLPLSQEGSLPTAALPPHQ